MAELVEIDDLHRISFHQALLEVKSARANGSPIETRARRAAKAPASRRRRRRR
jgi:hypothetical protein